MISDRHRPITGAVYPCLYMLSSRNKTSMVDPSNALTGREQEMPVAARHAVLRYCGLGDTGVSCPVGIDSAESAGSRSSA